MSRIGRGVRREHLATAGATSWWDAVDMQTGLRRVLRLGPPVDDGLVWEADADAPEAAWSPPVAYALADLLPVPGEPPLPGDPLLSAGVAAAGLGAANDGRLGDGRALETRLVHLGGRWRLVGSEPGGGGEGRLAALLLQLHPDDPFDLATLLAQAAPVDHRRWVVAAMAAHLAHERHVLARRADADRRSDAAAALRVLAARLGAAVAPPSWQSDDVRADGDHIEAAGVHVWDGQHLDAPAARALCRRLVGVAEAAPLRRWLVATSRLRVDRALLARR